MNLENYERYEHRVGADGARAAFRAKYGAYPRTVKPVYDDGYIYIAGPIPGSGERVTVDDVEATQEVMW